MQRIKDFFKGPDAHIFIGGAIALAFISVLCFCTYDRSTLTQEEKTALAAHRILEIHPEGNPTIVCFVLNNPGYADSISCTKK